ncbi:MAG TPA: hypothetical protein VF733_02030 [Candidatus Saccharimonadales bacterium]
MSEFSPYLSNLNQRETPLGIDRFERQRERSARMASHWKRFLQRKQRRATEVGSESTFGSLFGGRAWHMIHGAFARVGRRRSHRLEAEIEESRTDLQRYVLMAQYAINLAVRHDPNFNRRMAKKRQLMDKWRNLHHRVSLT